MFQIRLAREAKEKRDQAAALCKEDAVLERRQRNEDLKATFFFGGQVAGLLAVTSIQALWRSYSLRCLVQVSSVHLFYLFLLREGLLDTETHSSQLPKVVTNSIDSLIP